MKIKAVSGEAPDGTLVEVLAGPSASSLLPLVGWEGAGPVFSVAGSISYFQGFFDGGFAAVPGVPAYGLSLPTSSLGFSS